MPAVVAVRNCLAMSVNRVMTRGCRSRWHIQGVTLLLAGLCLVVSPRFAAARQIPKAERDALISLYLSTGGDTWTNNRGWLQELRHEAAKEGTECDEWNGVTCNDDDTHIIAIDLSGNNLIGRLPSAIRALRYIERLDLSDNRLTGSLPTVLWSLQLLTELNLSGNRLSGPLTDGVGGLGRLEELNLSSNAFSGSIPRALAKCEQLQRLFLSENKFSGSLPPGFSRLRNLTLLELSNNRLSGILPASWGRLREMRDLNLQINELSGQLPPSWSRLRELRSLYVNDNRISGGVPSWLFTLPELAWLSLAKNRLTGAVTIPRQASDSLRFLDLSRNALRGRIPGTIGTLELDHLDISHNRFNGPLPATVFHDRLDVFLASHNQLSGTLPHVNEWPASTDLSHNRLSGMIDSSVDGGALRSFSVAHNQFSGDLPASVLSSDARLIDLSHNGFTGALPTNWATSSDIRVLDLSYNRMSGPIPANLFVGEELLWVDLSNNGFTGRLPEISGARALQVLRVSNNQFAGKLPVNATATPWLAWLSVERNQFERGVTELEGLRSLQVFNGDDNPWTESPPQYLNTLARRAPRDFVVVKASVLVSQKASPANLEAESSVQGGFDRDVQRPGPSLIPPGSVQVPPSQSLAINGIVVDTTNVAVPGATVTAIGPDGKPVAAVTELDGRFTIRVSVPGEYQLTVEMAGFAVVRRTVPVVVGLTQDLRVMMAVGAIPETITVSAVDRRPARAWWNSWVSEQDDETSVPRYLTADRTYQFVLEIGSTSVRHANGVSTEVSNRLADHIAARLRQHDSKIPLTVRLLVIGRSVGASPAPDRLSEWRDGNWVVARDPNLAVLRVDIRRMARAYESPEMHDGPPIPAERYGAIRMEIKALEPGCTAIAASIWDGAQTVPLDQIVQIIAVGPNTRCEQYQGQSEHVGTPFGL